MNFAKMSFLLTLCFAFLSGVLSSIVPKPVTEDISDCLLSPTLHHVDSTFDLRLSGGPQTFFTDVPATGELETITVDSIQWTVTPRWDTTARADITGSLQSSGDLLGTHTFSVPPPASAGFNNFLDVSGSATYTITHVGSGSIGLVGTLQKDPDDTSTSCIGWILSFTVIDEDGTLQWGNGQVGFDPLNPFGFSCPTAQGFGDGRSSREADRLWRSTHRTSNPRIGSNHENDQRVLAKGGYHAGQECVELNLCTWGDWNVNACDGTCDAQCNTLCANGGCTGFPYAACAENPGVPAECLCCCYNSSDDGDDDLRG